MNDVFTFCHRFFLFISFPTISPFSQHLTHRQYLWIDEKGKRVKLPAPQYIDYALTFTQKTVNDESIFPTKCDTLSLRFPERTFESHVKQIIRLMFNVLAHIYHGHFKEIAQLSLHTHLNCLFSHLVIFNDTFKLVTEEKDLETLLDDVYSINTSYFDNQPAPAASRLLPPPPLTSSSSSPSNSSSQVQQQQQNLHLQSSEGGGGSDKKHDELQA